MGLKNNKTCEQSYLDLMLLCKRPGKGKLSGGGVLSREQTRTGIYCPQMLVSWPDGGWVVRLHSCALFLAYTSTWSDMLFPYRPPRPQEVSSKKPMPRFREVVPVKKHGEIRDPRFDERAGSFNESLFKKSYAFLGDMKKSEKHVVQKEARRARNPEKKAQLQTLIQQMVSDS